MPLAVRNWERFQHYKDRSPPWIKLYVALLDDPAFLALPDAAKGQLCALFLLAAKRQNVLPSKRATLRALIGCTGRFYLDDLMEAGWIVASDPAADASTTASTVASISGANPEQNARPSRASARSREVELEREKETTSATTAREAFLSAVPADRRPGWVATLAGWAEGMGAPGGKALAVEHIDAGLAEYLANEQAPTFAPRHVVRYVEAAASRPAHAPSPRRAGGSFLDLVTPEVA